MAVADYLWTVARSLRDEVYDAAPAGAPRDALDNSLRILTTLANALERQAPATILPPAIAASGGPIDALAMGPPENAAVYPDTGAAIRLAAEMLDRDPSSLAAARDAVAWEKRLLDAAVDRMLAVEQPRAGVAADPALQIDVAKLEAALRQRLGAPDLRIENFRLALGGRSRQTGLFSVVDAPGIGPDLVIQRGLPGLSVPAEFATLAAQYAVLRVLHEAGLSVPKPLMAEVDPAVLGADFIVVERSPGTVVETDYWQPPKQAAYALGLAEQMGRLHAQPIGDLDGILPQARTGRDRAGRLEDIERLAATWFANTHWPSVTMSGAIAWLRAHVDCVEDRRSLVHNDMVFHNILGDGTRVTAVLDWEQASIGHPAEDLGYVYPLVTAMIDWDRFMDAYCAAGGAPVSQEQVDFFCLRGLLRLMNLVMAGGRDAFEGGHADGVLVASAGAFFTQRLLHKASRALDLVLSRESPSR